MQTVLTLLDWFSSVGNIVVQSIAVTVMAGVSYLVGRRTRRGKMQALNEQLEVFARLKAIDSMKSEAELVEREVKRLIADAHAPATQPQVGGSLAFYTLETPKAFRRAVIVSVMQLLAIVLTVNGAITSTQILADTSWGLPIILQTWLFFTGFCMWILSSVMGSWKQYFDFKAELKARTG